MGQDLLIGRAAGQGIETFSKLLHICLKRNAYHVFLCKDYMSRVRGGENFCQIRFNDQQIVSQKKYLDLIMALDESSIKNQMEHLKPVCSLLCDEIFGDLADEYPKILTFLIR